MFGKCNQFVCDVNNSASFSVPTKMNISFKAKRLSIGMNIIFAEDDKGGVWVRGKNGDSQLCFPSD